MLDVRIRQSSLDDFEEEQWLIGVGWTLTIRRLPSAGFEGDGMGYMR
jgi:hypothetical protein